MLSDNYLSVLVPHRTDSFFLLLGHRNVASGAFQILKTPHVPNTIISPSGFRVGNKQAKLNPET